MLTNNAARIADFVNGGGGLLSHGFEFGWLTALPPSVSVVHGGSSGDRRLTPAGIGADPDGTGYWLGGRDGGLFAFGAEFSGSVADILLNAPMVATVAL